MYLTLLTLFLICFDQTISTSTTYHIATSISACGNVNGNCQTLAQFVTGSPSASNITLIMLDGNHILPRDWSTSYRNNITICPNSSAAVINCDRSQLIQFSYAQTVHISNISFIGCRLSATHILRVLLLRNSLFVGHSITGSALVLNNVAHAKVDSCTFTSNKVGTAIGRYLPPYKITQSTVGGAIFATSSYINVSRSRFENNSAGYGGAIFTQWQTTIIHDSSFINNSVQADSINVHGSGSAVYDYQGTVHILASTFTLNTALGSRGSGGALYFYESMASIRYCSFNNNKATYGGVQRGLTSTIHYDSSVFTHNSAISWGGVMDNQKGSNITIRNCEFERNSVLINQGGVVRASHDTMTIINSTFSYNTANQSSGGALSGLDSNFTIVSCRFVGNSASNRGGALYTIGSRTKLEIFDSESTTTVFGQPSNNYGTVFISNSADHGGAIYSTARSLTINGSILASNNSAADTHIFYIALTSGHISGSFEFSNNQGSVVILSSDIVIDANGEFVNNIHSGAISILQSTIYFNGSVFRLENNRRANGGAIYATQSQLHVNALIRIDNNRAIENGGGIYLYQSDIFCGQNCHLIIQGNEATKRGGGVYAISSLIMLNAPRLSAQQRWIEVTGNTANEGGGIALESNTKIYITQYDPDFSNNRISDHTVVFLSNSARYGGAMYVDDYANSVGACDSTSNSPTSECFFQVLSRHLSYESGLYIRHFGYIDNRASRSGPILHGGLLDRCTRSPFAEINHKYGANTPISGVQYFEYSSSTSNHDLTSISSAPVHVCPCSNHQQQQDCSNIPDIKVKKGQLFTVSLTAMNQVGRPVNATVTGYLRSTRSFLSEGQLSFITKSCERVSLRAYSVHDSEQLTLYASDGPCRAAPQSSTTVNIQFIPCNLCPIGFQPAEVSCDCHCHDDIKDYTLTVTPPLNC